MDFVKRQNEIIEEMMNGAELVSRPVRFGGYRRDWYLVDGKNERPLGIDMINLLVSSGVIRIDGHRAILLKELASA